MMSNPLFDMLGGAIPNNMGAAGNILRVAQLGRGNAAPLEIFRPGDAAFRCHHERGAAIHGSRQQANLAPGGYSIGIQRGAWAHVGEVCRAAE